MTKANELRDQTVEELEALYKDYKKSLFELKNRKQQEKKLEKTHLKQSIKKNIARVLTIITQKRQNIEGKR